MNHSEGGHLESRGLGYVLGFVMVVLFLLFLLLEDVFLCSGFLFWFGFVFFVCLFVCFFPQCSPVCPGTCSVDQVTLKLRDPRSS